MPPSHTNRCNIAEIIRAVNLGSSTGHLDSRGIYHEPDPDEYPNQNGDVAGEMQAVSNAEDVPIYSSYVTQTVNTNNPQCMERRFKIVTDGLYELTIKVAEPVFSQINERVRQIRQ